MRVPQRGAIRSRCELLSSNFSWRQLRVVLPLTLVVLLKKLVLSHIVPLGRCVRMDRTNFSGRSLDTAISKACGGRASPQSCRVNSPEKLRVSPFLTIQTYKLSLSQRQEVQIVAYPLLVGDKGTRGFCRFEGRARASAACSNEALMAADCDWIILCPCGLDIETTSREVQAIASQDWW